MLINHGHDITFELVSSGPPNGSPFSATSTGSPVTAHHVERANQQAVDQFFDQLQMRLAVEGLLAADAHRRARILRKPKPSTLPANAAMLTKREVAERLHVTERTIDRYVDNGKLKCFRIGVNGSVRFKFEDVERLLIPEKNAEQVADDLDDFITTQTTKG